MNQFEQFVADICKDDKVLCESIIVGYRMTHDNALDEGVWDSAKKWGKGVLGAGLLAAGMATAAPYDKAYAELDALDSKRPAKVLVQKQKAAPASVKKAQKVGAKVAAKKGTRENPNVAYYSGNFSYMNATPSERAEYDRVQQDVYEKCMNERAGMSGADQRCYDKSNDDASAYMIRTGHGK